MTSSQKVTGLLVGALVALTTVLMWPFVSVWAGDAIIHLRIGELVAAGHGLQYNLGEPGMATSSLLWTAFVSSAFLVGGAAGAAWIVKLASVLGWAVTAILTAIFWERLFADRVAGLAAGSVFVLSPAILHNAVGGMEASVAALIVLTLTAGVITDHPTTRPGLVIALTALLGLIRPEGVLFGGLLAVYLVWLDRGLRGRSMAVFVGVAIAAALTLLAQYLVTGSPLPDSGASRMAAAMRESVSLGPLHVHTTSAILFALMLPATAGLIVAFRIVRRSNDDGDEVTTTESATPQQLEETLGFALLVFAAFLFFYTFVFGGKHATRYWIPLYPIVLGAGAATTAHTLRRWYNDGRTKTALLLASAAAVWLAGFYVADWHRRHTREIGIPHGDVVHAVANRPIFTQAFLEDLGATPGEPIVLAVTEVQVRYFLDDEAGIYVSTLDGRTSTDFREYVDEETGLRKFAEFLRSEEPDFIELVQFDPREPILPEVTARWAAGEDEFEVDGFTFQRTGRDPYVRFLGER